MDMSPYQSDKKVVGVFVRFSCATSIIITTNIAAAAGDFGRHVCYMDRILNQIFQ
jgi:hypothetical protein